MAETKLEEMLRLRRPPADHSFKPRVIENLSPSPVEIRTNRDHKALMKQANAVDIGDAGIKDASVRPLDRSSDNLKRSAEEKRQHRTYTGRLPEGYGKK